MTLCADSTVEVALCSAVTPGTEATVRTNAAAVAGDPAAAADELPAEGHNADAQGVGGLFDCNICLDTASEPVITRCGHLYCWPCMYQWIRTPRCAFCPICKSELSEDRLIPLYGRGRPRVDPRDAAKAANTMVPDRPPGYRPPPQQTLSSPAHHHGNVQRRRLNRPLPGLDTADDAAAAAAAIPLGAGGEPALSPEQVQQAFLSRLLLLLGSFVILCLLLL